MKAVYWYVYAYLKRRFSNWWITILMQDTSTWLEVGIEGRNSEEDKRNLEWSSKRKFMILQRSLKHTFQNFKKVMIAAVRMNHTLNLKLIDNSRKRESLIVSIIPRSSSLTSTWKKSSTTISIATNLNFWVTMRFKKTLHTFLKKITLR